MRLCSKQAQAHFIGNAVTYNYRKMYFRMNSTVRTYISGVIFFYLALPDSRLISVQETTPIAMPSEML